MTERAAVDAFDIDSFFSTLLVDCPELMASREPANAAEFREKVLGRVEAILRENESDSSDPVSRRDLFFTSFLLAAHREIALRLGDSSASVSLLRETMTGLFARQIPEYLASRFGVDVDEPEQAFRNIATNFVGRGKTGFGAGFTYEQEVQAASESFINVTRCSFLDYFRRNGEPELTSVICAMDAVWADEINRGPYDVRFSRPTMMSEGDDKCRFQFTKRALTGDD